VDSAEEFVVDVRVPSLEEIAENPKRCSFIGGGWVDSDKPNMINLYWHARRRKCFTVYSLLNVFEHETLHAVLAYHLSLQFSIEFGQGSSLIMRLSEQRDAGFRERVQDSRRMGSSTLLRGTNGEHA
jgi:hypothetical protein